MAPFDDIVQNIFGITNIYTRSFLELLQDKTFFDVGFPLLLIMIATLSQPYQYPSQELLVYRGKGLNSLRSEIARTTESKIAPSDMMIANLVKYYVHELVDFNAAAALAVMILAAVVPLVVLQQSLPREGRYGAA